MDKKTQKIKSIVKGTAPESKFGTDPNDPWSSKSSITESGGTHGALAVYLKSRGINPKYVTKDQKIAHTKSGQFARWMQAHMSRSHPIVTTTESNHLGDLSNISGSENVTNRRENQLKKRISKQKPVSVVDGGLRKEEVDKKDTVTMDIPLLIRMLELAREDIKSDAQLHRVVEKLIDIRNKGTLTMHDYDFVSSIKEQYFREDKFQDTYAATQTVGPEISDESLPNRKKQLSKSARIIKSIYKKNKMTEDLYDHEKEDKSVEPYGKKTTKKPEIDETIPSAYAVMTGGKTMTGQKRDNVEIDPKMKHRPGVSTMTGKSELSKREKI